MMWLYKIFKIKALQKELNFQRKELLSWQRIFSTITKDEMNDYLNAVKEIKEEIEKLKQAIYES